MLPVKRTEQKHIRQQQAGSPATDARFRVNLYLDSFYPLHMQPGEAVYATYAHTHFPPSSFIVDNFF